MHIRLIHAAITAPLLFMALSGGRSSGHDPVLALAGVSPIIYIAGISVAAVCFYNLVTGILASRERKDIARDPSTGILEGVEAFDIGPEDSPGAVLLLHGFIGTVRDFDGFPEWLADAGWHVRAMRIPGHGTRPQDLERESPDALIEAVLAEYDSLLLTHTKVVLVGHSMGGTLAVLAASQRKPDAVVLAAPYFGITGKWYYGLNPITWAKIFNPFIRWMFKGNGFVQLNRREAAPNITSYRWVPMKGVKLLSELGDRANRDDVLGSISCPVLFIHSRHDDAASPERSLAAYERMHAPGKRFVWLERSNHLIFWDYDREIVTGEILSFIGRPQMTGQ